MHRGRAVGDAQRPAGAAPGVATGLVVLDRLECRQHVGKCPAPVSGGRPAVIVLALSAHPHHRVDGARAAEQLAARPVIGVAGEAGIRFGAVVPVHARIEEGLAVAERHLHEEAPVAAARLEDQHRITAAGRKALRHDRTGGPRPDDDEIESLHEGKAAAWRSNGGRLGHRRVPKPSRLPARPVKKATAIRPVAAAPALRDRPCAQPSSRSRPPPAGPVRR